MNNSTATGLKEHLLPVSSSLDSGSRSSSTSHSSSGSSSSFVGEQSGSLEDNDQGWGDRIGVQIQSFFNCWRAPVNSELDGPSREEQTSVDHVSSIEEGLSSQLPLPERVIALFDLLQRSIGERPDPQQRLFFNLKTGETAWQSVNDVAKDWMDHKPLNYFYEILDRAEKNLDDNSSQQALNQVQKLLQSSISLEFFSKVFVIRCDDPEYKNYVYLVDRQDLPKLSHHPDNPRVYLKGTTMTNSIEDNDYIARKMSRESTYCLTQKWQDLFCCLIKVSIANLVVVPAVAALSCTQYGSMAPFFHAISVSCMPWQVCNDACSFWISTSVTMGLPIDCCYAGLHGLVLFYCCDQQETLLEEDDQPRFLVDKTFNRLMGEIRASDTLKFLFDEEHTPEVAAPSVMTMSR